MNVMEKVRYLCSLKASRSALDLGPASYCTRRGDPSLRGKGTKVKVNIEQAM
jgi:hypothetical protein